MQQLNFGISNAANILLVQERDNPIYFAKIESTAFLAQSFLCFGVLLFALGNYYFDYSFTKKYPIGWLFYLVCAIGAINYFVQLCMGIYRIKHQFLEIGISQSIVPLITFIVLFLSSGKDLLLLFVFAYFAGNIISLFLFIYQGKMSIKSKPSKEVMYKLLSKGLFLFVYNCCFYFIIISTRTTISHYYQVEEFGYFTFAYALADSVLLLLAAISFLLFPKSIEKLHTSDIKQVKKIIHVLRINYMTLTHGIMYIAFMFFPLIIWLIPKYSSSLPAIYMISLALLCNTCSCGYSDYLMAQSKDKQIAMISLISLSINVTIAIILAGLFHLSFEYIVLSTIISYWSFSVMCVYFGYKQMGVKVEVRNVVFASFPARLLIPFISAGMILRFYSVWLLPVPFMLFVFFNYKAISEIFDTFIRIIKNPRLLDVSGT